MSLEEFEEKIEKLVKEREGIEMEGAAETKRLGPLKDKLKTAQQREIALKESLQQQAAKFEMFQVLLVSISTSTDFYVSSSSLLVSSHLRGSSRGF